MAYQNVVTPRFWVNVIEWLNSSGYETLDGKKARYNTLPVLPVEWNATNDGKDTLRFPLEVLNNLGTGTDTENAFFALLGHNMKSAGGHFWIEDEMYGGTTYKIKNYINLSSSGSPDMNGFTIALFDMPDNTSQIEIFPGSSGGDTNNVDFGSIIFGTYYDMPHSPDLSLKMSREYKGTKNIETKGGSSLSNTFYSKPPMWGDAAPWELWNDDTGDTGNQILSNSGRRVWDLSFSYLQDSDIMPELSKVRWEWAYGTDEGAYWSGDYNGKTLLDSNTFYSQVIHKTNGGQLPFIFQPDNSISDEKDLYDAFAICKFDMDSFQFEQVANGVYNVKLKIREVW